MIKYIFTTSNQNEIQISTWFSWKEIAGLQNTKATKLLDFRTMEWPFDFDYSRSLLQQQMYQIYICHYGKTVTFPIFSCFSFYSQLKSQNTTWIHNFLNIYCEDVWFNVLKVRKLFHVILLTDNWWIWILYLQNQIRLPAGTKIVSFHG